MSYKPQIGQGVFIAPNATIVGQVELGNHCSVWYNAVIRADEEKIIIGERSNVQDGCILHADAKEPILIGKECILGHGAIVHSAQIGSNSLIGMRASILNRAKVGSYCLIGAHTLVTQDMEVPDYSLVLGCPARIVKRLKPDQVARFVQGAEHYVNLAQAYLQGDFLEAEK